MLLLAVQAAAAGFVRQPVLTPVSGGGAVLLDTSLPPLLDKHRDLLRQEIGGKQWALGVAAAADVSSFYFTFEREGALVVLPVDQPKRLLKPGLSVEVEPAAFCSLRIHIGLLDLFAPLRCATLKITAAGEKPREITTGELLDTLQAKTVSFEHDKRKYWLLYSTDIDPVADEPAGTRSLIIVREDGLKSRVWPVPESALGSPALVDLGETKIVVSLSGGRLTVSAAP